MKIPRLRLPPLIWDNMMHQRWQKRSGYFSKLLGAEDGIRG